jgi:hypothetical protein
MKPRSSIQCSKEPINDPYPQTYEFGPFFFFSFYFSFFFFFLLLFLFFFLFFFLLYFFFFLLLFFCDPTAHIGPRSRNCWGIRITHN